MSEQTEKPYEEHIQELLQGAEELLVGNTLENVVTVIINLQYSLLHNTPEEHRLAYLNVFRQHLKTLAEEFGLPEENPSVMFFIPNNGRFH
jgi:hypothetical protein